MAASRETLSMAERLIEFIQKNRRLLFVAFIAIIVGLAGSIAGITLRDRARLNAFVALDALEQRLEPLWAYVGSDEAGALLRQGEITALLEELAVFAARTSGFPAARAHTIRAAIFEEQQRWPLAQTAWTLAANAAPASYLAPISLFNAAVAAEEHGDLEAAIEMYARVLAAHSDTFFIATRAQFSIGRLEEARNNTEAALAAYRSLLSRWPDDPLFANLAQSRIIVLSD
ncbi:MAG: tetratricopeptide repeat protein [Treponema sp.]|nr:tetratricopeptide repeat protein [Treponema sp.]